MYIRRFIHILLSSCLLLTSSFGAAGTWKRVVSLDLCSDWMLLKYVDPGRVAALSPFVYEHPPVWMQQGWPAHDGSLEQVLALKPDLVITGEFNAILLRQRLQELGLNVAILPLPTSMAGINDYTQQFARLLDVDVEQLEVDTAGISLNEDAPRLLMLGANGLATGRGTLEDDMIRSAGWRNYVDKEGYTRLELEALLADPPDAVTWSAPGGNARANSFAAHPALRKVIPRQAWLAVDFGNWQCVGPWTAGLIEQLTTLRQAWRAH